RGVEPGHHCPEGTRGARAEGHEEEGAGEAGASHGDWSFGGAAVPSFRLDVARASRGVVASVALCPRATCPRHPPAPPSGPGAAAPATQPRSGSNVRPGTESLAPSLLRSL